MSKRHIPGPPVWKVVRAGYHGFYKLKTNASGAEVFVYRSPRGAVLFKSGVAATADACTGRACAKQTDCRHRAISRAIDLHTAQEQTQ